MLTYFRTFYLFDVSLYLHIYTLYISIYIYIYLSIYLSRPVLIVTAARPLPHRLGHDGLKSPASGLIRVNKG